MNKPRIIGIGIATMDIYCYKSKMYPGGNEFNIAYNAKILGADSAFMGIFADDELGKILEKTLVNIGVDVSHSHHEIGSSGYALVDLRNGDRYFIDWNKEGVTDKYPFLFTKDEMSYIKRFDVACISWGARVSKEKIVKLSSEGISICYDFNDNFTNDDVEFISCYVDYAFFSASHISEGQIKNILEICIQKGCKLAIATRGENPTIAYDGSEFYYQSIKKVKPIDTMGAGDSFISSFLYNYLLVETDESKASYKIKQSLKKAAEFAAEVVKKEGALGIGYDVDLSQLKNYINI